MVALAEEIETPGEGKIRALVTIAGNPVVSTPNGGGRLDAALASLDFMVSVDIYVNETTRHADVILPAPDPLAKSHYDVALLQLAVRNVANYSPPVVTPPDQPDEWEILAKLALLFQGAGADADPSVVDDLAIRGLVDSAVGDETGPLHGRDPERSSPRSNRGEVRSGCSTSCCEPVRTARASARIRTGCPSTSSRRTRTASISARSSLGFPTCCARRPG